VSGTWPAWLPADGSQGVIHDRPGGGECTYLAIGVCNKCGWSEPSRSWVIELPSGLKVLSLNDRYHWAEKGRRAASLKKAAWAMAVRQRVPRLAAASIVVEYQPPDRRHRDHDNIPAASGKHCIDGVVAAGVLEDDQPPFVTGIFYRIGEPFPKGRLVLTVTEVPAGTGGRTA